MSAHTPGPWKCGAGTKRFRIVTADRGHVVGDASDYNEAAEANARLIAAAPTLLAALQAIADAVQSNNFFAVGNAFEDGGFASVAIAKAEGR